MASQRILLHVCCGPCAIVPAQRLIEAGWEVTALFHNPNIHPLTEYLKRREGILNVADRIGFKVICKDDEYDPQTYFRAVSQREANRCFHCYAIRLERAHSIAKRGRFDTFTSTLLYSKHQKHATIAGLGRDIAGGGSPIFHYEDYRTGWQEGIEASKTWGIYRQQYCGCLYSEYERFRKDLQNVSGAGKPDS